MPLLLPTPLPLLLPLLLPTPLPVLLPPALLAAAASLIYLPEHLGATAAAVQPGVDRAWLACAADLSKGHCGAVDAGLVGEVAAWEHIRGILAVKHRALVTYGARCIQGFVMADVLLGGLRQRQDETCTVVLPCDGLSAVNCQLSTCRSVTASCHGVSPSPKYRQVETAEVGLHYSIHRGAFQHLL
jgi:hypothetical protein